MTTILAFGASTSSASINHKLAIHAANLAAASIEDGTVEVLDLNDYEMPIYSQDRQDADGIPEPAQRFYDVIGAADAIIISFAEHNGSYSAAFKNVYDWASRIDMQVYQNRPVLMLATAPGGRGGQGVLEAAKTPAPFFGADLQGTLSVPSFYDNFDADAGELTDPDLAAALADIVAKLASAVAANVNSGNDQ